MGMGAGCADGGGSGVGAGLSGVWAGVRWNSSPSDVRALAFPFVDWNFESEYNPPDDPFDAGWITLLHSVPVPVSLELRLCLYGLISIKKISIGQFVNTNSVALLKK